MDFNDKECSIIVIKYFSICFYSKELVCFELVDKVNCEKIVEYELICGYIMFFLCYKCKFKIKCIEFVEKIWLCGYLVFIECVEFDRVKCKK